MGGETRVCICTDCGGQFLFRSCEQARYRELGWVDPKRCPDCRAAVKERRRKAAEGRENAAWQKEKAEEQVRFEEKLTAWRTVPVEDVRPKSDRTLYVLGNGFDLMHGVRSSYYAFRDSLGKRSDLRWNLETFLTPEDIWADFEEALGHFDGQAMGGGFLVDQWLDDFGAYDRDATAADFFLAVEAAGGLVFRLPQPGGPGAAGGAAARSGPDAGRGDRLPHRHHPGDHGPARCPDLAHRRLAGGADPVPLCRRAVVGAHRGQPPADRGRD